MIIKKSHMSDLKCPLFWDTLYIMYFWKIYLVFISLTMKTWTKNSSINFKITYNRPLWNSLRRWHFLLLHHKIKIFIHIKCHILFFLLNTQLAARVIIPEIQSSTPGCEWPEGLSKSADLWMSLVKIVIEF